MTQQLKSWLAYKYRTRRVCYQDKQTGKVITELRTPSKDSNDLIFAVYQNKDIPNPDNLYIDLIRSFGNILDRSGKGNWEDNNQRRRKITLHSFRRYTKSTSQTLDMLNSLNGSLVIPALHIGQRKIQRRQRYFTRLSPTNIPKYTSIRKTRCRYTKQGRRTRRNKPILKKP